MTCGTWYMERWKCKKWANWNKTNRNMFHFPDFHASRNFGGYVLLTRTGKSYRHGNWTVVMYVWVVLLRVRMHKRKLVKWFYVRFRGRWNELTGPSSIDITIMRTKKHRWKCCNRLGCNRKEKMLEIADRKSRYSSGIIWTLCESSIRNYVDIWRTWRKTSTIRLRRSKSKEVWKTVLEDRQRSINFGRKLVLLTNRRISIQETATSIIMAEKETQADRKVDSNMMSWKWERTSRWRWRRDIDATRQGD